MNLLLDTQLLLWAAGTPERLSQKAYDLINAPDNILFFSAASLWEIVTKQGLARPDFQVDARATVGTSRQSYSELPIDSTHAGAVANLPPIHKDPFDRILIAQAHAEGFVLLTSNHVVAQYQGPIQLV